MSPSKIKEILQKIDIRPGEADNRKLNDALPILFQLIELLSQENEELKAKNQKLRDEINLLKGNRASPKYKAIKSRIKTYLLEKR